MKTTSVTKLLPQFAALYSSARAYGTDRIVKAHLGLAASFVLPVTFPHGVDSFQLFQNLDVATCEPLYAANRDDIAERVGRVKAVLRFPHPWLLMAPPDTAGPGQGTLFIAPPPSHAAFTALLAAMQESDLPKPWRVLVKATFAVESDFLWWQGHGVETRTAGPPQHPEFYFRLRAAMLEARAVASPNMSSAVIFAAALGRQTIALPDVILDILDVPDFARWIDLEDREGHVRRVWQNLFSTDSTIATAQAHALLGHGFLDTPDRLRARLEDAIERLETPLHLHPLPARASNALAVAVSHGLPVHRLFPNPAARVIGALRRRAGAQRLAVLSGSDLAHYGIAGAAGPMRLRMASAAETAGGAVPGAAVRVDDVVSASAPDRKLF